MKLETGKHYDIRKLDFQGWSNGEDNPSYNCWDYFYGGVYLGPDEYGIEPVFASREQPELTPANCGCSQLACNIVNNTFLSLDGFQAMRNQMAGTDYTAEHFGAELARIVDSEMRDANAKMQFAEHALRTLQDSQEWGADTTDSISSAAIDMGLAQTDECGYFQLSEKAKERMKSAIADACDSADDLAK